MDAGCRLVPPGARKESLNHWVLEHLVLRIPYPPPSSPDPRNRVVASDFGPSCPERGRRWTRLNRSPAPSRGRPAARNAPARGGRRSPRSPRDSRGRADPDPPEARAWFEQALGMLAAPPQSQSTRELAFELRLELRPVLNQLGETGACWSACARPRPLRSD